MEEYSNEEIIDNIDNNDTLLISEVLNKVILPYTGEEVEKIIEDENNEFSTKEQVIDAIFTKPLSDYKYQAKSRYNETIKLVKNSEDFGAVNSISFALEMMRKRYLHPAIITACRNVEELYVYLDCLEKNELDDFKIFNIKYELHPIVVKNKDEFTEKQNWFQEFMDFIKNIFGNKGKRYI